MTTAYAYLRVSSDGQAGEDRDGLRRQQRAIATFAKAHDYQIAATFADEGISGTVSCNARPAYKKLLAALYGDSVHTVIVESPDRLGRDAEVILVAVGELKRAGFQLLTATGQDLTAGTIDGRLRLGIDSTIAEYVRAQLVERLRSAREAARKRRPDYREGRKPFGTRAGEAEVIAEIQRLRSEGKSVASIAKLLNNAGVPARNGEWHTTSVQRVLERVMKVREPYKGYVIEARGIPLRDGGYTAHGSIEKHYGFAVDDTPFETGERHATAEAAVAAGLGFAQRKIDGK